MNNVFVERSLREKVLGRFFLAICFARCEVQSIFKYNKNQLKTALLISCTKITLSG